MSRLRVVLVLCALLALSVGVPAATAGDGNSEAAKACHQGGWQDLERADGTLFKNQGECVSYAAQGGVPTTNPAAAACEAFSGATFSTDPSTDGTSTPGFEFIWSCNGHAWTSAFEAFLALGPECFADGGTHIAVFGLFVSCVRAL
jgi:hypothetical protein